MTKRLGDRLPPEVVGAFDGRDLVEKTGIAYLVVTSDADCTPRPCMLSAGEILCSNDSTLRIALWPGTNTSKNLERGSALLLCYVARGTVLYVKGIARRLEAIPTTKLDRFEVHVESVESDEHPGMPVTDPIRFEVDHNDKDLVAQAWAHQIDALGA